MSIHRRLVLTAAAVLACAAAGGGLALAQGGASGQSGTSRGCQLASLRLVKLEQLTKLQRLSLTIRMGVAHFGVVLHNASAAKASACATSKWRATKAKPAADPRSRDHSQGAGDRLRSEGGGDRRSSEGSGDDRRAEGEGERRSCDTDEGRGDETDSDGDAARDADDLDNCGEAAEEEAPAPTSTTQAANFAG